MLLRNCFSSVSQGSKLSAHAVKTCQGECTHHLQSLDGGCSKLPHQQAGLWGKHTYVTCHPLVLFQGLHPWSLIYNTLSKTCITLVPPCLDNTRSNTTKHMHARVSLMCTKHIYRRKSKEDRAPAWTKLAFEFSDISKVLQPSPSAKMAWHSNFTIAVFLLHSALFVKGCFICRVIWWWRV